MARNAFLYYWVFLPFGITDCLLTDNGPQLVAECFNIVCAALGTTHMKTTSYHPQTNGQTERYNRALVNHLRKYVYENQTEWDKFVQSLTYAYIGDVHRSTGTCPFDLTMSRHLLNQVMNTLETSAPRTLNARPLGDSASAS